MALKPDRKYSAYELVSLAIASLFGVGLLPKMPGTFGSAVALLLLLLPVSDIHLVLASAAVAGFVLGLAVVPDWCDDTCWDPSFVVIDEAVAVWLIFASPLVPHDWGWVAVGFGLFRLFDIWKPFPIGLIERRKGAFAVMADDIMAAVYASICLHLLYSLYLSVPLLYLYFYSARERSAQHLWRWEQPESQQ